jgi:hypothetical protein
LLNGKKSLKMFFIVSFTQYCMYCLCCWPSLYPIIWLSARHYMGCKMDFNNKVTRCHETLTMMLGTV